MSSTNTGSSSIWGGVKLAVSIFLTGLFVLFVWGSGVEPRFLLDVRSYEAEVPQLPPDWEGRRVALLADFQIGMWLDNPGMTQKALKEALRADPSLLLIAGDFLYRGDSTEVEKVVRLLQPLNEADVPAFAVLGNHDYSLLSESGQPRERPAQYLESQLEDLGIRVLENEAVPVDVPDDISPNEGDPSNPFPLYVAGVGSAWAERSRPAKTVSEVPDGAPRLVLMHNPVAYRRLPAHTGPLTLTAHTHGGQIRLPYLPSESWLNIAYPREIVADGWAVDSVGATGNRLYVNRGIGFSRLPVRINCRPELTLFTLRPASATLPDRGPDS